VSAANVHSMRNWGISVWKCECEGNTHTSCSCSKSSSCWKQFYDAFYNSDIP